jgi:membrane AbrB-like protein
MTFLRTCLTLVVSILSGFLFSYLNMPLPWMLGPLTGMILWSSVFGGSPCWSQKFRNAGLIVLGYVMGRPFTSDAAHQILSQFPEMALMTALTVLFSLLMSYVTYRQTGISLSSCIIGGVPGGLAQMVAMGEEIPEADATIVTFMQTIRVLTVVFSVPFLALHVLERGTSPVVIQTVVGTHTGDVILPFAGAVVIGTLLAVRFKMPIPYLVGPVLATCVLVVNGLPAPALPPITIIAAQLSIGTYMGVNIRFNSMQKKWRTIVPYTLLNAGAVLLFCLGLGWLLTRFISVDLVTGFLSTAPGGITEMGLTAMQVNADLSTVVAYHIFRMFFILLIIPIFLRRWLCSRDEKRPRGDAAIR